MGECVWGGGTIQRETPLLTSSLNGIVFFSAAVLSYTGMYTFQYHLHTHFIYTPSITLSSFPYYPSSPSSDIHI
jgi:hypothetical protein